MLTKMTDSIAQRSSGEDSGLFQSKYLNHQRGSQSDAEMFQRNVASSREGFILPPAIEEGEESNSSNIVNADAMMENDFQVIENEENLNEDNLLENLDKVIDTEENNYLEEKSYVLDTRRNKDFEDQDASFIDQFAKVPASKHDSSQEQLDFQEE